MSHFHGGCCRFLAGAPVLPSLEGRATTEIVVRLAGRKHDNRDGKVSATLGPAVHLTSPPVLGLAITLALYPSLESGWGPLRSRFSNCRRPTAFLRGVVSRSGSGVGRQDDSSHLPSDGRAIGRLACTI